MPSLQTLIQHCSSQCLDQTALITAVAPVLLERVGVCVSPSRPPAQLEWDEWSQQIWLDGSSVLVGMLGQERGERQDGGNYGNQRESDHQSQVSLGEEMKWEVRGRRGMIEGNDRELKWKECEIRTG